MSGQAVLIEDVMLPGKLPSACQGRVLRHLMDHSNRVIGLDELVDVLYGDDEDGGPLVARACIRRFVFEVRRKLRPEFEIRKNGKRGYSFHAAEKLVEPVSEVEYLEAA